jgi:16S rRNA (guanine1207-N2)-methyltransferase
MTTLPTPTALYGQPPAALAPAPKDALQVSPLLPGSSPLEALVDGSLLNFIGLAPPGTQERACVLAHALRALAPSAPFTILAPKAAGGTRLLKELAALGADSLADAPKAHHRIVSGLAPRDATLHSPMWTRLIADTGPQLCASTGLWTQPGVFSWNRLDPGTALLLSHFPTLYGRGADLGCGIGHLSRAALAMPKVSHLTAIDLDRRAVEAAKRNLDDPRLTVVWGDALASNLTGLDFVVMNPPFHDGGAEDRALGQGFVRAAASALRTGGRCCLVANRHLPYEATLAASFAKVTEMAVGHGFKVFEAVK